LREARLDGQTLYRGKIVNVRVDSVALPDGRTATREVVEHPGGVAVVAVTDAGEVFTVRQYRYPFGEVTREIPAGKLEPGEDPLACALRELREETGYVCGRMEPLGVIYASPGVYTEKLHLYLALDLTFVGQKLDDGEFLHVESTPLQELVSQAASNEIKDAKTIIGIMLAQGRIGRPQREGGRGGA